MRFSKQLVRSLGKYNVYVEHFKCDEALGTILLVNGALATTGSFTQTAKYLVRDLKLNVVLFDLPYAGGSREHNPGLGLVSKDDEVGILKELIDHFSVDFISSISWGGVAALLAIADPDSRIKKAVIASFSPILNEAFHKYIATAELLLSHGDKDGAANELNSTVGKYLPPLLKRYNHRYLTSLPEADHEQIFFHIRQILGLDVNNYLDKFSAIRIPVLFINGELDEYTTAADARTLGGFIGNSRFITISGAGHFLDLESKAALRAVRRHAKEFLVVPLEKDGTDHSVGADILGMGPRLAVAG